MVELPPRSALSMPDNEDRVLGLLARRLGRRAELTPEDREAILALPYTMRTLAAGQYLVWDGDAPGKTSLLLSGFAFRHKHAGNGGRQILSFHMTGDLLDLQSSLLGVSDHNVQMLTSGSVALFPVETIREIAYRCPNLGMALWHETLVEAAIVREWVVNIGRRDARTRIAHLLCEFALRLELAELGQRTAYELPITQEQLADAVSLTSVHVNRTLMKLEGEQLITRVKRVISILDWDKLVSVADFEPRYLHLTGPPPAKRGPSPSS